MSIYSWNQKNLDYEIETFKMGERRIETVSLKSKEPRLRDWNFAIFVGMLLFFLTWNQKNLDYEIETFNLYLHPGCKLASWNQKNLDYEIETLDT